MNTTQTAAIEWTTKTNRKTVRFIAKCKCKAAHSVAVVRVVTSTYRSDRIALPVSRIEKFETTEGTATRYPEPWRCACGKTAHYRPVNGSFRADKKCDARCLNSKGHVCECQCGGKNHGAGHA